MENMEQNKVVGSFLIDAYTYTLLLRNNKFVLIRESDKMEFKNSQFFGSTIFNKNIKVNIKKNGVVQQGGKKSVTKKKSATKKKITKKVVKK